MCGGFTCSKNTLIALNILYFIVSFVLIGVGGYGLAESAITNLRIVSGIVVCGAFLCLLSVIGLVGAVRHNQVLLFFYMVILFLLFIVQFAIACACLAINEKQQHALALEGWQRASPSLKNETQIYFDCCGFENKDQKNSTSTKEPPKEPSCAHTKCCKGKEEEGCSKVCSECWEKLERVIGNVLKISGGIGLFFSFTEFLGVWLTFRYRNQKNPDPNPRAFL